MTIRVFYSCPKCDLVDVECEVPARGEEHILEWMDQTIRAIGVDHQRRSPNCHPKTLHNLKIPTTHAGKIGGPSIQ